MNRESLRDISKEKLNLYTIPKKCHIFSEVEELTIFNFGIGLSNDILA